MGTPCVGLSPEDASPRATTAGSGAGRGTAGGAGAGAGSGAGAGGDAPTGGSGAGAGAGGAGAGGAAGGGGVGAARGGSRDSGSTYVSPSPTRMPRWTYGTSCSGSPEGPASATEVPSATLSPRLTRSGPRWVSETLYPPVAAIVTVRPCVGTCPANVTSPDAGARTTRAPPRAMSTPRCCPPAYGLSPSENSRSTSPSAGQAQACAAEAVASAHPRASATPTTRRVVLEVNTRWRVAVVPAREQPS